MRFSDWLARWFDLGRMTRLFAATVATLGLATVGLASTASAASKPGTGKPAFVLGDKNFPEEYVLGALYQQALQAQGYTVTLKGTDQRPDRRLPGVRRDTALGGRGDHQESQEQRRRGDTDE
jgi:hypothetical protein